MLTLKILIYATILSPFSTDNAHYIHTKRNHYNNIVHGHSTRLHVLSRGDKEVHKTYKAGVYNSSPKDGLVSMREGGREWVVEFMGLEYC